ncbi:MAG: hypothetical protein ACTTJS_05545 [Wolinella sp.]
MNLDELRAYFEDMYSFLHGFDEPKYDKDELASLFNGIELRVSKLEAAFASGGGSLPVEIGGRFFFVYQNASILFKYALLVILTKERDGGALLGRGFLKVSLEAEREKYRDEFAKIEATCNALGIAH